MNSDSNYAVIIGALIVLLIGLAVIYGAMAFVNLNLDTREWSGIDRVAMVVLSYLWARFVWKQAEELAGDDFDEE